MPSKLIRTVLLALLALINSVLALSGLPVMRLKATWVAEAPAVTLLSAKVVLLVLLADSTSHV
jgi:hypothetical protein